MSERRNLANRANAQKSTGPRTAAGKLAIARNGLKHGILSKSLFLDDENPQDFAALYADLEAALRPVGALELALVEKVAAALWRQRRLVRAETALIERDRRPDAMAYQVGGRIGRDILSPSLNASDLEPMDGAAMAWCRAALAEAAALEPTTRGDWRTWETAAPVLWQELHKDAGEQDPADYLVEEFDGDSAGYVRFAVDWCRSQINKADQSAAIQAAVRAIRDERAVLSGAVADTMGRHAEMLDRELYRAIKALREAQDWRLGALESVPGETLSADRKAAPRPCTAVQAVV